jgi:branched-chain amino acid transport system ATP-binding protein
LALLEVRNLAAGYGRAQVLFGVSLEVRAGEAAVLLGPNGAGKSTTLKAIMGLLPGTSGEIFFNGKNILGQETHEVSRLGIGYVPEDRRIFGELTVAENLEVGRRPGPWTAERVFDLFPALADMRERPGARMSGGEQKMLAIARTLMGNPRALLLDEPSEGIAPILVEQFSKAILNLKDTGVAVLLAEQNQAFARRVADRSYTLERGKIADGQ